jgi:hypothetical protein
MQFVLIIGVYLLHSTLLLGGVWGLLKMMRVRSFVLQEQLWKGAAIVPLVTAPLQQLEWLPRPELLSWTVVHPTSSQTGNPEPARSDATPHPAIIDVVESSSRYAHEDREIPGSAVVRLPSHSVPGFAAPSGDSAESRVAVPPVALTVNEAGLDEFPASATGVFPHGASNQRLKRSSMSVTSAVPRGRSSVWPRLLTSVIVAVAGIGLLRLIILSILLQRRLRQTVPVKSGPGRECLDELLLRRRIRRPVRLMSSADLSEPAAFGLWNWSIVIPRDVGYRLERDELAALLAHEVAHLVRRDTAWLWIGRILCALAPWQPLNFQAVRRWRTAAEHLCDAWAVEQGVSPLTLARCLARVAEYRLNGRPAMGLTATGSPPTLAARIELLASGTVPVDRTTRRRGINAAIAAAALLLVCCGPRFGNGPATAQENTSAIGSPLPIPPAHEKSTPSRGDEWSLEVAASDAVGDEELLRAELRSLLADLRRLNELLAAEDESREFRAARGGFKQRIAELERRLKNVTAGVPSSPTSHPIVPARTGPVQETMP